MRITAIQKYFRFLFIPFFLQAWLTGGAHCQPAASIEAASGERAGWEANPQRSPLPDLVFQHARLVDILDLLVSESGVRHAFCIAPELWSRELVNRLDTEEKDLETVLDELAGKQAFAYQWAPDFLLLAPDSAAIEWFRAQLDTVTKTPVVEGTGSVGSATEEFPPSLNARVFRLTDDMGANPESTFRRLEVIRGVVEILKVMLYEDCESDPDNPQRRIIYPESRHEEIRDPRFLGTITVIDTPENLRKVAAYIESANRSLFEFQKAYEDWLKGVGEHPQKDNWPRPMPIDEYLRSLQEGEEIE